MKLKLLYCLFVFAGTAFAVHSPADWERVALLGKTTVPVYETEAVKRGLLIPLAENHPAGANPFPEVERAEHLYAVEVPSVEFFSNASDANPDERLPVILIAPGGGYSCLAYRKEGVEIARQLLRMNCHTAVLKYPVNCEGAREAALKSAHRALAVLKSHAEELKIDPEKIGMMGFSAGAHLTARLLAEPGHPLAFGILIYPAYLSSDGVTLNPEVVPSQPFVPTFVMQCRDDRAYVNSSLGYAAYLTKANAPVSYHLYSRGGHGFGGRLTPDREAVLWHTELHHWFERLFAVPGKKLTPDEARAGYRKVITGCGIR